MIVAQLVGGPYDGSIITVDDPTLPVVLPRSIGARVYVEMRAVDTAVGWRLFWPHGAS